MVPLSIGHVMSLPPVCVRVARVFTTMLLVVVLGSSAIWACNIPVFRYALERWRTDNLELRVFHSQPLAKAEQELLDILIQATARGGGHANLEVRKLDVRQPMEANDAALWAKLGQAAVSPEKSASPLSYAVVSGRHLKGQFHCWQGPLSNLRGDLLESPVRQELARRLLSGHAIVWLLLNSSQAEPNRQIRDLLDTELEQLTGRVELPEGIGLPGSELYSEVPLLLKFSVLEIERHEPREEFLLGLFSGFQPEAYETDEPLVIPVFGRGRALEVIPASQMTQPLINDLTQFLCAACSCQVKEQNPGFDLLLNVPWDAQLFGDAGLKPPAATADGLRMERPPVLLTIPPGNR